MTVPAAAGIPKGGTRRSPGLSTHFCNQCGCKLLRQRAVVVPMEVGLQHMQFDSTTRRRNDGTGMGLAANSKCFNLSTAICQSCFTPTTIQKQRTQHMSNPSWLLIGFDCTHTNGKDILVCALKYGVALQSYPLCHRAQNCSAAACSQCGEYTKRQRKKRSYCRPDSDSGNTGCN